MARAMCLHDYQRPLKDTDRSTKVGHCSVTKSGNKRIKVLVSRSKSDVTLNSNAGSRNDCLSCDAHNLLTISGARGGVGIQSWVLSQF